METAPNTFVDFHGDFPKPESRHQASGKELAEMVASGLRERRFDVQAVEDVDIAYSVRCVLDGRTCEIWASIEISDNQDRWTIHCCPPHLGFFERLRGRWDPQPFERLLLAVDDILKRSDRIRDVRWFPSFDMPESLDQQVAYADPTLDHPLSEPPTSSDHRLVALSQRVLDWCWSPVLFGVCFVAVLVAAAAGFMRIAFLCIVPLVFAFSYTFAYFGVGLWIWGWLLFRSRREQRSAFAYPGLAIALLGGALLVFLAVSAIGGFVTAVLGRAPP